MGRWLHEVDPPHFGFVGVLGVGNGCLMVLDVEGGQLVEVELLEAPQQVFCPRDGGFPPGDEHFMFCFQVGFDDVLPDEPVPPGIRIFMKVVRASRRIFPWDQGARRRP